MSVIVNAKFTKVPEALLDRIKDADEDAALDWLAEHFDPEDAGHQTAIIFAAAYNQCAVLDFLAPHVSVNTAFRFDPPHHETPKQLEQAFPGRHTGIEVTPLEAAMLGGCCYEAAERLLELGASVEYGGQAEQSPLNWAVLVDDLTYVDLLLKYGAEVDPSSSYPPSFLRSRDRPCRDCRNADRCRG